MTLRKRIGVFLGIAAFAAITAIQAGRAAQLDDMVCLKSTPPLEFAPLDAPPLVRVTHEAPAVGGGCFNKTSAEATWITVTSLVETSVGRRELMRGFGSISQLVAVRYWSVTDGKWRPLVSSAVALSAAEPVVSRADYSADELERGETTYYRIADGRSGRAVTYSLRVGSSGPLQFAVETANVDAVKEWGLTLFAPGGLRTVYYLTERAPGRWAYSSVTRIVPASFLARGHEKSYVNRAVALYRHYTRIPTDREPPAAP